MENLNRLINIKFLVLSVKFLRAFKRRMMVAGKERREKVAHNIKRKEIEKR